MIPQFPLLARTAVLIVILALVELLRPTARAENVGGIPEVEWARLSDRTVSPLGQAALQVRPQEWRHGETEHFVYHFFQSFVATPVSVEAEFFYKIIAQELQRDTRQWERKCHIFLFENAADWAEFQKRGALDPWTGGLHAAGELFIHRDASRKWKGHTLGHEIAHLVVYRFFGPGIPLWLNEGYAEYAASRGYASFYRARGYAARPRSQAIDPALYLPVTTLTSQLAYPADPVQVGVFYGESERLVRFLSAANKAGFSVFFEAMARGNRFESALSKGFGSRFASLEALDREFKEYATQDHGTSLQD